MINNAKIWSALFAAIMIAGLALRLPRLEMRPMHTDEAVHAVKFGNLLEQGTYRYDPHEYHGPTLTYSTLLSAWLSGIKTYPDLTETALRIVPVIFGLSLIPILLLIRKNLGWPGTIAAAFFTAISPAMVYYSRYYIMEILLVFFLGGIIFTGWKYQQKKSVGWALALGASLGLLYATKETSIVFLGSMAVSLLTVIYLQGKGWRTLVQRIANISRRHVLLVILTALVIGALFYSSFVSYPRGVLDSIRTFQTYFERGAGESSAHIQPWYYYLHILLFWKYAPGPFWSEAPIVILAGIGFIAAFQKKSPFVPVRSLLQFIALFTLIAIAIFSLIPYKTPWNLLGFYYGMIILAGAGTGYLFFALRRRWIRVTLALGLVMGACFLLWQTYITNFTYSADARNPYVYGHTSTDIYDIVRHVNEAAEVHPAGKAMHVEVIAPGGDYWPLPWYLREYPTVGWWTEVAFDGEAAPVILAKPSVEQDILKKLYAVPPPGERDLYVPLFREYLELRPHVELRGYVKNDLWERLSDNIASSD